MIYIQALIKLLALCVFNQPSSLKRSDARSHYVQAAVINVTHAMPSADFCVIPCEIGAESSLMFVFF
jgi:hypothetical protein